MKKLKEIARLLLECNLGIRPIARACNISVSTASFYAEKFKELGATYQEICETDEDALSNLLFPKGEKASTRALPDFVYTEVPRVNSPYLLRIIGKYLQIVCHM